MNLIYRSLFAWIPCTPKEYRPLFIVSTRIVSTGERQVMRWYTNQSVVQKYLDKHKNDTRFDEWKTEFKDVEADIIWDENLGETTDSELSE